MKVFKPITTEAALGTDTSAASNVGSSEYVRLHNTAATGTEYLITLEESGGTDIGTFSLDGSETVIIFKEATDKLFAGNAAVKACGVAIIDVAQPKAHTKHIK
tara:strand:- start:576 stop:884 length:309 start_codon:yes stop_codon:yes gene_type:complete